MEENLMAFNMEDYEPVAARLARFWVDHPAGAIFSELIFDDGERCVVKATVHFNANEPAVSSDYAEEIKTDRGVNATSRIENCCTSAQGRALAAAGYLGTDWSKKATREEMSKVSRGSNFVPQNIAPAPPEARSNNYLPNALATEKQQNYIRALGKKMGLDPESLTHFINIELKSEGKDVDTLSIPEAKQIIDAIKPA
jgi:hypothetical protein